MNIPEVMPTELSGFCDVATGECIVVDADIDTEGATEVTSQPPEIPNDRPALTVPKGS
ncbi:MAG: hypothetical protein FWC87_02250 [Acidimicrobiaceae bacterium]|nr:hypothetical protein [Acidimicrobiaceae bacterium]